MECRCLPVAVFFVLNLDDVPYMNKPFLYLPFRSLLILFPLLTHLVLFLPLAVAWHGAAALLLLGLPGILLMLFVFPRERDLLTRIFLGICGGLVLPALLLLALQSIPGSLSGWWVVLICDGVSLILVWLLLRQHVAMPVETRPHPRAAMLALGVIVLLGAILRLRFLGNAEFQGDEARALLMAVGTFHGQDGILLTHTKGPVEVLLPLGPLVVTGQINEWVARLPFALAGVGTILGSYVLAHAMFSSENESDTGSYVGLIAAAIVALNGFLIAFSRIVQYQSVLVLMMLGALWCCWRFYTGVQQPRRYLIIAAVLAAVGLLAHYDGVFVLPALVWLTLRGCWLRGWHITQWTSVLAWPLLVGAVLVGSFYIPFVLNEHFNQTLRYLAGRVGQDDVHSVLYNQLTTYHEVATVYNTTFQVYSLSGILALACVVWLCHYLRPRLIGYSAALLLLTGCAIMLRSPEVMDFNTGQSSWAIAMFGVPLVALALAPSTPAALRTLVIWFACPFIAESFLIISPNTHFYTMETAAALLAGLALVQLSQWLYMRLRWLAGVPALGISMILLLAIPYVYIVFVRQMPEYRRAFPGARPAIYQASYGDKLPDIGYFGFAHRSGWKVIGELYGQGLLQGSYMSNEEELITSWYTHGAVRNERNPDYYFVATTPNDPIWISNKKIRQSYHLFGTVTVDSSKKISIYSLKPVSHQPYVFNLDMYRDPFDQQLIAPFSIKRALE